MVFDNRVSNDTVSTFRGAFIAEICISRANLSGGVHVPNNDILILDYQILITFNMSRILIAIWACANFELQ